MATRMWGLVAGLALAACGGSSSPAARRAAVEEAAAQPDEATLGLVVDGRAARPTPIRGSTTVRALLPADLPWTSVRHIRAEAADGTHLGVRMPAVSQPDVEFRLSSAEGGVTFTPTLRGGGTLDPELHPVEGVVTLRVERVPAEGAGGPAPLVLRVGSAPPVRIEATDLAAFERITDGRGRASGWSLLEVVAARVGPGAVASLTVHFTDPARPPVGLEPLDGQEAYFLVKHSDGGALRIQKWRTAGEGGRAIDVHRDIDHLAVTLAP